jgi:uncharacterized membrane protein YccC
MRRLFAAAAMAAVVLAGTACGSGGTPSADQSSASAAGGSDTKAVCDRVQKVTTDAQTRLQSQMQDLTAAIQSQDPTQVTATVQALKDFLTGWASSLRQEGGKASDQGLNKALDDFAAQLEALVAKITDASSLQSFPAEINNPDLTAAGVAVQGYCPSLVGG